MVKDETAKVETTEVPLMAAILQAIDAERVSRGGGSMVKVVIDATVFDDQTLEIRVGHFHVYRGPLPVSMRRKI